MLPAPELPATRVRAKYCSSTCKGDAFRGRPRPYVSRALKGIEKTPEMRAKL